MEQQSSLKNLTRLKYISHWFLVYLILNEMQIQIPSEGQLSSKEQVSCCAHHIMTALLKHV